MTIFFGNSSGNLMADRRYDLALQLAGEGDFEGAADLLRQGLEITPDWPPLHFHLGEACRQNGKADEAKIAFQDYLTRDPNDKMGATVKLSLMGAIDAPSSLPAGYVQSLFDQYAPKFEKSLVEDLSYHTPEFIFEDVSKIHSGPFENALDLGCGTGLAAQMFDGHVQHFTGIDLAPAMIDIARDKNIYRSLHVGDIDEYLRKNDTAFDLVLSADVFVYIGALEKTFALIAQHMQKDGLFAFSVQTLQKDDWTLGADHRYAHSKTYIERCAKDAGLYILSCREVPLRLDAGAFIQGMVFVCRKS